jgi:hypothetical protein
MDLTSAEQQYYQAILAEVETYLETLAPPLQVLCRSYVTPLRERSFIQMMSLLPYWLADIVPTPPQRSHQLGLAHFYTCWYYHAQDDLLDEETPAATLLGAHLALLKMVEIYEALGLTTSEVWHEFQRLSHISAETYAVEMQSRFTTLTELTPARLAPFTVDFVGNRVTPFYFNTLAQCYLAGLSLTNPQTAALTLALRCFMTARQIGDDAGDWLTDLQAGQLNYVAAALIRRLYGRGIISDSRELNLERLAGYQVGDEDFWAEIEQTSHDLHQQALTHLAPYSPCQLQTRLIEPQLNQHRIAWEAGRIQRTTWRQMFGVKKRIED